jgi:tRNA1(Val) A37 N6-methylase TrmN6
MQEVLNDLFDYENMKIYQYVEGFKFSADSILLAEYVHPTNKTKTILDLCTGNASIPLILSTKTKAHIDAFEIQKEIAELGVKSVKYNNLDNQITIYNDSIKNIDNYLKSKKYDIITCNPPYFKVNETSNINSRDILSIARHELTINLEEIFQIASSHLNTGGEFYLVHRSNRLDEIIINGNLNRLIVKNIQLIKTKDNNEPTIVLVRCVKDAKLGLRINDIISIENIKTYQNMFKEDI